MRLVLPDFLSWDDANFLAYQKLSIFFNGCENRVRLLTDPATAISETLLTTARFLSHKKTVGIVIGQSWLQKPVVTQLQRDGFNIVSLNIDELSNPEEVLSKLGDECSCVFIPADNPITGERILSENLESSLNKKRIISIKLFHFVKDTDFQEPLPYSLNLFLLDSTLTLAICGQRYKTPFDIGDYRQWDKNFICLKIDEFTKNNLLKSANLLALQAEIINFEKTLKDEFNNYFDMFNKPGLARSWDRSIIISNQHSGEFLLSKMNIEETAVTMQLCSHQLTINDLDWWDGKLTPDQIRGMIFLTPTLLTQTSVQKVLLQNC